MQRAAQLSTAARAAASQPLFMRAFVWCLVPCSCCGLCDLCTPVGLEQALPLGLRTAAVLADSTCCFGDSCADTLCWCFGLCTCLLQARTPAASPPCWWYWSPPFSCPAHWWAWWYHSAALRARAALTGIRAVVCQTMVTRCWTRGPAQQQEASRWQKGLLAAGRALRTSAPAVGTAAAGAPWAWAY